MQGEGGFTAGLGSENFYYSASRHAAYSRCLIEGKTARRNDVHFHFCAVVHTHNGAFPELLFYLRDSRVESFSFFFAYLIGHKVLLYKLSLRYCHVKNKAVFLAHCLTCSLPPSKT